MPTLSRWFGRLCRRCSAPVFALAAGVLTGADPVWASEAKAGLPQFNPAYFLPQLVWLILIFGGFYALVVLVLVPRIRRIKDTRQSEIATAFARAQHLLEEVRALSAETERRLAETRQSVRDLLTATTQQARAATVAALEAEDARLEAVIREGEARIATAKTAALAEAPATAEVIVRTIMHRLDITDAAAGKVAPAVDAAFKA